jgi:rod shape-determining protein MreB
VLAIGETARQMEGRTSQRIEVRHPVQEGLAASPQWVEVLVRHLLRQGLRWQRYLRPTLTVSVPLSLTPVEREALLAAVAAAGGGPPHLVSAPLAAARGANMPVDCGCMVADLGANRTQGALLYLGNVLASDSLPVGGRSLDAAIVRHLRLKHGLAIGEQQAEILKLKAGVAAAPAPDEVRTVDVMGRDVQTGLPRQINLGPDDMLAAVEPVLAQIATLLRQLLSKTPPELATDLIEHGILLTGGTALLPGLAEYLQSQCHVPVRVADQADSCVVRGAAMPASAGSVQ